VPGVECSIVAADGAGTNTGADVAAEELEDEQQAPGGISTSMAQLQQLKQACHCAHQYLLPTYASTVV
jgi:hypothetical protein